SPTPNTPQAQEGSSNPCVQLSSTPFVWSDGTCDFCREGLQTSSPPGTTAPSPPASPSTSTASRRVPGDGRPAGPQSPHPALIEKESSTHAWRQAHPGYQRPGSVGHRLRL